MNPIAEILSEYPVIVLDGALATELELRGCDLRDPLWSAKVLLETPELIRRLHLDYFAAGADCATTASYQATVPGFARRGIGESEALGLIQRSVELALEARNGFWSEERTHAGRPRPFVAASIGPYGAFLADGSEYRGNYGLDERDLMEFHRPRMRALLEAGAEVLACETIPCFLEAQALAHLLEEFPHASAWFSFSARDGRRLRNGEEFKKCVAWLEAFPQVSAVGVNCTSPQFVPSLITSAREVTRKPILAYPNSGEAYDSERGDWYGPRSCDSFGEASKAWYSAGARIIGGCCRTSPEDIRAIAAWARSGAVE